MKNVLCRFASFFLGVVMLSGTALSVTSCKKKTSDKGNTIPETEPWYTATRVELDPKVDESKYMGLWAKGPWLCRDHYIAYYYAEKAVVTKRDEFGFPDMGDNLVGIFDNTGTLLHMIDLDELLLGPDSMEDLNFLGAYDGEKGVRILTAKTGSSSVFSCEIDLSSGKIIGSSEPVDLGDASSGDEYIIDFYQVDDLEVYKMMSLSRGGLSKKNPLVVRKDGKVLFSVDFERDLGQGEIVWVYGCYEAGKDMLLLDLLNKDQSQVLAFLDTNTGKVTKAANAKPISENQKYSALNGESFCTKATGIYLVDAKSGQEECKLNFDYCDVNRYESQRGKVLQFDENKVILGCESTVEGVYLMPTPIVVYTLQKAEKNPNAGKKILTVASLSDSLSFFEGEAIKLFNEQNPEYFAKLKLYDQNQYVSLNESSGEIDQTDRKMFNAMAMVGGSLASDIRSGDGPDVILGAAQVTDLLDSKYLEDMSAFLTGEKYDATKYYANVVNASKIDGKLYFMPTTFRLSGIVTDGSALASDQKGFTFEQYVSFVKDQCNGIDPVTKDSSRLHFFSTCVQSSYSKWISDRRIDFNADGFKDLVKFFKESIPEGRTLKKIKDQIWLMSGEEPEGGSTDAVFVEDVESLEDLAGANYFRDGMKVLGLPSADGSGPSAKISGSFSISALSEVKEGGYALLSILLSDDVQKNVHDAIPVSRAAEQQKVEKEKKNNENGCIYYIDMQGLNFSPERYRSFDLYERGSDFPKFFLDTLESIDSILISDNAVLSIISEEIPPYFLGQKELDEAIRVINNRAKNVFDER